MHSTVAPSLSDTGDRLLRPLRWLLSISIALAAVGSSGAAVADGRSPVSPRPQARSFAPSPVTLLKGDHAIEHLKIDGQYESLAAAYTAARYAVKSVDDWLENEKAESRNSKASVVDPDSDPVTISGVSPTSAAGGTVTLTTTSVTYNPLSNYIGADSFNLTLSDDRGGEAAGTVGLSVTLDQLQVLPGGLVQACFVGESGRSYVIERSANLTDWTTVQTTAATVTGDVCFTDTNPFPDTAFYRTRVP